MTDYGPANGDRAFIAQIKSKIKSLEKKKNGESDTDVLVLNILLIIYSRMVGIEKISKEQARFPSLIYMFVKRPMEAVPYGLASLILAASFFVEDVRLAALTAWGLPPDIFQVLSGGRGTAAIAILVMVGLIAGSKNKK